MDSITILAATILVIITSFVFGESLPLKLPLLSPFFDRKPFNCRPCFTFHLTWIGMTIVSVLSGKLLLLIIGFIAAFLIYIAISIIEKSKIEQ